MQVTKSALSLLFLLGCSNQFHSISAFSIAKATSSTASQTRAFLTTKTPTSGSPISPLRVSTSDTVAVADMQRGIGGRLEDAFESAKERGEAAFVTFVTAGYPRSQGE